VGAVSQTAQNQALRDLDQAFRNFFAGRAGYPMPRRRGVNDGFRHAGREIRIEKLNAKWARVFVPKIGWIKTRRTRDLPEGSVRNATLSRTARGWRIAFAIAVDSPDARWAAAPRGTEVGIDRGVVRTLALSDGTFLDLPKNTLERRERTIRRAQKAAARHKRGSARHRRAMARVRKLKARQAACRRHHLHVWSRRIAQDHALVAIEDLKTRNMTRSARGSVKAPGKNVSQKAGLNRAILASGWHLFETMLAYKTEDHGGRLEKVPANHTSQTCSACGHVDRRGRESQARFVCSACGHRANADTNAAINILRRANGASLGVEGKALTPREAPTERTGPGGQQAA